MAAHSCLRKVRVVGSCPNFGPSITSHDKRHPNLIDSLGILPFSVQIQCRYFCQHFIEGCCYKMMVFDNKEGNWMEVPEGGGGGMANKMPWCLMLYGAQTMISPCNYLC